jgi:hypothetical protein
LICRSSTCTRRGAALVIRSAYPARPRTPGGRHVPGTTVALALATMRGLPSPRTHALACWCLSSRPSARRARRTWEMDTYRKASW